MRKISLVLIVSLLGSIVRAQNVWTGTTTPTTTNGKVGIGTTSPSSKLSIASTLTLSGTDITGQALKIENKSGIGGSEANIFEIFNQDIVFPGPAPQRLIFWTTNKGNVGILNSLRIGTAAANGDYANYKLSVDGDIIAKRCVIQVTNWADYVFDDNYHLRPLKEVEEFINANKHLPDVPNENEVKNKGVEIGEMNRILMQKVEELTLYIINQNKKIETLESRINNDY
ncbi:hypothetical protein [Taibaiella helva]|uniref:hypothetical protein n=1 Tax=Taibaiella helva TaxID=2301235 RepID=UPI000E59384B|nr:hypothetical protein [Taibaiella helva]